MIVAPQNLLHHRTVIRVFLGNHAGRGEGVEDPGSAGVDGFEAEAGLDGVGEALGRCRRG